LFLSYKIIICFERAEIFSEGGPDHRQSSLKKSRDFVIMMAIKNLFSKTGGGRNFWNKIKFGAHDFAKVSRAHVCEIFQDKNSGKNAKESEVQ
jgi:hypothetical protein